MRKIPPVLNPDVLERDEAKIERLCQTIGPVLDLWFRPEVRGLKRVPEGSALIVGNHNGGMMSADTFVFGIHLYRAHGVRATPYVLGHDMLVDLPGLRQAVVPLGAVRASSRMARQVFEHGRKLMVYPGGDEDALRPYADRDRVCFAGRTGYVRLALRDRVPIVPVVAAGAHEVFMVLGGGPFFAKMLRMERLFRTKTWPLVLSVPWGLTLGSPPPYVPLPVRMLIEVLEPMRFDREGPEAAADDEHVRRCDDLVRARMQSALTRLAQERRETGRFGLVASRRR